MKALHFAQELRRMLHLPATEAVVEEPASWSYSSCKPEWQRDVTFVVETPDGKFKITVNKI